MRRGVRLGLDPGQARIGVSVCDSEGRLAVPLETVAAGRGMWERLCALVAEHRPLEVVVGLPLLLSGREGAAAEAARQFAGALAGRVDVPVRLVDERLSTVEAERSLRGAGRSARSSRPVVDQAAAAVVLQAALDLERSTGRPPGAAVDRLPVPGASGR